MADVTIVPLSEENVQLFSQTAAKILPEAWSFETYKKQLSNPDDISFLALCNGEAAGFISVWCVCGEAEINNIGVLEKFRRMGIAKALFDSAYNAAKAEKSASRKASVPKRCSSDIHISMPSPKDSNVKSLYVIYFSIFSGLKCH